MAYIDVTAFKKLRAFLWGLQKSGFNLEQIPFKDEQGTPIDKESSLKLLHTLPDFQKEEFKDDNTIVQYLKKRSNFNQTLDQFTPEQQNELTKALEEEPAIAEAAGEQSSEQSGGQTEQASPVGAPAGGMPGMGMPSAPSISSPRFIHNVPHTPEVQKPEIIIANKSGYVAEKPPTEFHVTDKAGNIQATYSKNPAPITEAPQSKLVVPGAEKGDPSKLVAARSDGSIVKPTTPTPKIAITDRGGIREHTIKSPSRFNFPSLKSSASSAFNKAQKFTSGANPFLKTNLGRISRGLTQSVLPSGASFLGRTGLSALNHGGNFLSDLSNNRLRFSKNLADAKSKFSLSSGGGKKAAIAFAGAFFLILFMGALGGITGNTSTGEAATLPPETTDISTCEFTRAGSSAKFQSPLLLSYIQEASQKSSIPPVVLAAFIRVESPSSSGMSDEQISDYSANCAQSPTGALGIMQIQPPGSTSAVGDPASCDDCIDAGAKLVGKTAATMTEADYCDPRTNIIVGAGWILKKMSQLNLGDGTKWDPAWTNDTNAIKTLVNTYYGCLNYGGATDCTGPYNYATDVSTSIQNCQQTAPPYQPGAGSGIISCPLNNPATITNGSKDAGGHCSQSYEQDYGVCAQPEDANYTGKETAIDVTSSDHMVFLPRLNSGTVTWTIVKIDTNTDYTDNGITVNGGYSVKASAQSAGKNYLIRFVHIDSTSLIEGQQALSEAPVGFYRTKEAHVHITIKENDKYQPADLYFNLCK